MIVVVVRGGGGRTALFRLVRVILIFGRLWSRRSIRTLIERERGKGLGKGGVMAIGDQNNGVRKQGGIKNNF